MRRAPLRTARRQPTHRAACLAFRAIDWSPVPAPDRGPRHAARSTWNGRPAACRPRRLGITFDGEPVVQSQRLDAYQHALLKLADRTYECFCSRREIAEAASAPHGSVARYPGTCRNLTEAERIDRG